MAFKKIPLTIDTMIRNPVPIEGINQEDNIELNIVVTENKTPKDLSRQTIKVYVRRIDGTLVEQTDQITPTNASKGEVTVKLKNSAFNKEGYALFQLDISDSSGRITSSYATFKIGKGLVSGEAIANTNEIEALKKVEEYIKKANQELETFKQTVAEINENEATRQENEVVRVREEASRNEAEAIRAQQEATRKEKENERVQAEIKRIADEEMRRENEVLRGSKELERKQAEELRKETELLRIGDENNRKVAESKRIEAESVRVEAEKLRVAAETGRVEAESLRVTAEEGRVAAETKREEGFNAFEGKINANTEELKGARSATTGEQFDSLDERIDCEIDRINKKIEVSMLQQEDKGSHVVENSVVGMTTDMIVKGRTLQNVMPELNKSNFNFTGETNLVDGFFVIPFGVDVNSSLIGVNRKKTILKPNTKYTVIADILENNTGQKLGMSSYGCSFVPSKNSFDNSVGISMITGTTKDNFNDVEIKTDFSFCIWGNGGDLSKKVKFKAMVLEGDWTNKPIPKYFESIKSFGQQEDKISILSHNKNFFNINQFPEKINEKGELEFKADGNSRVANYMQIYTERNLNSKNIFNGYDSVGKEFTTVNQEKYYIWIGLHGDKKDNKVWGEIILPKNTTCYYSAINEKGDNFVRFKDIQIEIGTSKTHYKEYKEDKKDILLSEYGFDEGLRGINDISDELNSLRNVAIKRIGKREYREGDLLLENVITDKINTYYVLEEPIETHLVENINLKTFDERTYVRFENSIPGTSSFKSPVNVTATISRLNRENRALEEENKNLRQDFESTTLVLTDSDLELVKQNVDMDFRLMEVEFALDIPQAILSSDIKFKNKKGEVKSMARTPYEMMKIVILSGDYDREDYMHKVGKYYERGRMTKEEHDELMSLMTADEVIGG